MVLLGGRAQVWTPSLNLSPDVFTQTLPLDCPPTSSPRHSAWTPPSGPHPSDPK